MAQKLPLTYLGEFPDVTGVTHLEAGDTLQNVVNHLDFGNFALMRSDGIGGVTPLTVAQNSLVARRSSGIEAVSMPQFSVLTRGSANIVPIVMPNHSVLVRSGGDVSVITLPTDSVVGRLDGNVAAVSIAELQGEIGGGGGGGATTLPMLTDVILTGPPTANQVLMYREDAGSQGDQLGWTNRVPRLADLANVASTSPVPNQGLVWNGTSWAPADVLLTGAGLNTLFDVTIPAPSNPTLAQGDILTYIAANSSWEPRPHAHTVAQLTDTDIDTPVPGHIMLWTDEASVLRWRNTPLVLDALTDVDLTGAQEADILTLVAGEWVATRPPAVLGPDSIDSLTDTQLGFISGVTGSTGLSVGDILVRQNNGTQDIWRNQPLGLGLLIDTDLTSQTPINNDVLTFIAGDWVPRPTTTYSVETLTNTEIGSPVTANVGDVLTLVTTTGGNVWRNQPIVLATLGDVSAAIPDENDILAFVGGQWTPIEPPEGAVPDSIDSLTNTDIAGTNGETLAVNQVLLYTNLNGTNQWRNRLLTLGLISDVTLTGTPADKQVLYRSAGQWINQALVANDLADISTAGASNFDVLRYNSGSTTWEPLAFTLRNLTDTTIGATPTNKQSLVYNSVNGWQNVLIGLSDLGEVDLTTEAPTSGDILGYNGTEWVPTQNSAKTTIQPEQTVNFSAAVGQMFPVNTIPSGVVSVAPPPSPATGDVFEVVDSRANAALNSITVDFIGASQNLYAQADNYILTTPGQFARFRYINTTIGWIVESN